MVAAVGEDSANSCRPESDNSSERIGECGRALRECSESSSLRLEVGDRSDSSRWLPFMLGDFSESSSIRFGALCASPFDVPFGVPGYEIALVAVDVNAAYG